jgi:CelD/BcsL family acetyltransferase involved in cellulose biosynthesis
VQIYNLAKVNARARVLMSQPDTGSAIISDACTTELAIGGLRQGRREDHACDITITEGIDAVEAAASAWTAIENTGGVSTPFQSLAIAHAAAKAHVAEGDIPRIVTVRERGRPLVIFPTVTGRWAGASTIRFLGDPFIQYADVIAAPDASSAHLEAAWTAAADGRIASVGIFRKVRSDGRIAPVLTSRAGIISGTQAPFVDLRTTSKLASHHARELRRLRRRLTEQGELKFDIIRGPAMNNVLREAIELKRAWLIERGLQSVILEKAQWENVLFALVGANCGQTEMMAARLTVGGLTAAIEIGFADRTTWFAYIGALAPKFAKSGPGHVLMEKLVDWCRESRLTTYDLLPPVQPYKQALTARAVQVTDYAIALRITGYPGIFAARLLPVAKAIATASPLLVRRQIVRRLLRAVNKL